MSEKMQRPANDPAAAVRLVERFLDRLTNDPDGDPAEALALLPRELPAYGACLIEWPAASEPAMLAVAGLIQDVAALSELQDFVASAFSWQVNSPVERALDAKLRGRQLPAPLPRQSRS